MGSWDNGASKLRESEMLDAISERVLTDSVPILGICLGMQLLLHSSEEGELPGLGWIPGRVKKFSSVAGGGSRLRVPHMGWNVASSQTREGLVAGFGEEMRFYFVHSYHAVDVHEDDVLMTCNYGQEFVCAVNRGNIWGVQFHPEKSHKFGMKLMKNFAEL